MSVITISREFGSGGRELGKRLADHLGYSYYDKEIIAMIASDNNLDNKYVENTLNESLASSFHFTFRHSFFDPLALNITQTRFLLEQKRVIEEIAKREENIVIVGRNADFILRDYSPLKIFVCASTESKIKRCKERNDKDTANMSDKEIESYIKRIDKNRKDTTTIVTAGTWGDRSAYDLIVNTSDCSIKEYAKHLAPFVLEYFSKIKNKQ